MKQILLNIALIDATTFCRQAGIDCAGSHIEKTGRGFKYSLVRTADGSPIVSVTFHKSQVPTRVIHQIAGT